MMTATSARIWTGNDSYKRIKNTSQGTSSDQLVWIYLYVYSFFHRWWRQSAQVSWLLCPSEWHNKYTFCEAPRLIPIKFKLIPINLGQLTEGGVGKLDPVFHQNWTKTWMLPSKLHQKSHFPTHFPSKLIQKLHQNLEFSIKTWPKLGFFHYNWIKTWIVRSTPDQTELWNFPPKLDQNLEFPIKTEPCINQNSFKNDWKTWENWAKTWVCPSRRYQNFLAFSTKTGPKLGISHQNWRMHQSTFIQKWLKNMGKLSQNLGVSIKTVPKLFGIFHQNWTKTWNFPSKLENASIKIHSKMIEKHGKTEPKLGCVHQNGTKTS